MAAILEVDENGALLVPAEVLGDVPPHTQYIVEGRNGALVLRPHPTKTSRAGSRTSRRKLTDEAWSREWEELQRQIAAADQDPRPAVEIISEMRRW